MSRLLLTADEVERQITELGLDHVVDEWTRRAAWAMGISDMERWAANTAPSASKRRYGGMRSLRRVIGEAVLRGVSLGG